MSKTPAVAAALHSMRGDATEADSLALAELGVSASEPLHNQQFA